MRNTVCVLLVVHLILILSSASHAQMQNEDSFQKITIKPIVGFEIFRRNIDVFTYNSEEEKWEKDESSSLIKSYHFTVGAELEFPQGFSIAAFIGYSFADYDPITYRRLPISVEMEAKKTRGFLTGFEINKDLFHIGNIEVGGFGQFFYHTGSQKKWEISGLNVEGSVSGKPWWMCVSVGPTFSLLGSSSFHPFASLNYNRLWGKFKMDETILDLEGIEEKKIQGKSVLRISLGAVYNITESFGVKAEAGILPYGGGVDVGFLVRLMYSH